MRTLEIVVPSDSYDLVTLQEVKLAGMITGNADDALLTNLIAKASKFVSKYCNQTFTTETVMETFHLATACREIVLSRFPITSVLLVTLNGTTIADEDMLINKQVGWLSRKALGFPVGFAAGSTVEVTYSAGYAVEDVPEDLKAATVYQVAMNYQSAGRDPLAKRIEIPDVQTVDYWVGGAMPEHLAATLDLYRQPSLSW